MHRPRHGVLALALFGCPQDPPLVDDATSADPAATTVAPPTTGAAVACDASVCVDGTATPCVDGVPGEPVVCAVVCLDGLGCRDCEPGAARCSDAGVERCDDAGAWTLADPCSPEQGLRCDPATLTCTGPCAAAELGDAGHLGCEFYAAPIASLLSGSQVFGVLVTNPGDRLATVTADKPLWVGSTTEVPAGTTAVVYLPWAPHLLGPVDATTIAAGAAVRLRSDRPVSVVQHSPLDPGSSADASLLLPVRAWSTAYRVASAVSAGWPGLYAVVAAADGVTVELAASAGTIVLPGDGVAADGTGTVVLDRGDVLQVLAASASDLTGAGVTADGPIAVIGGHLCAEVPAGVSSCDHLEETMPPVAQLGRRHAVVAPLSYDGSSRRDQVVRIVATEDLTSVEYDPPQDLPALLVYAGDRIDIEPTRVDLVITTSAPVLVAQYMLGRDWDDLAGAPSLTIATPVERWRERHVVHAAAAWPLTDVDVVAPAGAAVTLDGEALTGWSSIGASGLAHAHVRLLPVGQTTHVIAADVPIGAQVSGPADTPPYSASYWHPAGHALAPAR